MRYDHRLEARYLKKLWQNGHLEKGDDCCPNFDGNMGGRRRIPHLWLVPSTDHRSVSYKPGDITGTIQVNFSTFTNLDLLILIRQP